VVNSDRSVIRLATLHDLTGITALLQANSAGRGGTLNGDFPADKVEGMLRRAGARTVVAQRDEAITGVLFSAIPTQHEPEMINAMLHAWPPGWHCWLYGPACISEAERGKGLLKRLYHHMCQYHQGAPVLFIQAQNSRSIQAHQRLGMYPVAQFAMQDEDFFVYSHQG